MSLNDIPLFAALRGKLTYDTQRQSLLAQNVANADTPDFAPKDLKAFTFDQAMQAQGAGALRMARTDPGHLQTQPTSSASFTDANAPDSEVRLDGNHVVLEEQMMKVNEAQGDYTAAIGFYQQSLSMLKAAIHKPGT